MDRSRTGGRTVIIVRDCTRLQRFMESNLSCRRQRGIIRTIVAKTQPADIDMSRQTLRRVTPFDLMQRIVYPHVSPVIASYSLWTRPLTQSQLLRGHGSKCVKFESSPIRTSPSSPETIGYAPSFNPSLRAPSFSVYTLLPIRYSPVVRHWDRLRSAISPRRFSRHTATTPERRTVSCAANSSR